MFGVGLGRSATRRAPRERPARTNQGIRLTTISPVNALPPELVGSTLFRVPLIRTLFHERSRYSAIEGLCGTFKRWTDNLRGNRGSEGRGRGRGSTPLQPRNSRTPTRRGGAKKRGRIGPWGRHRCSLLQPIAPACKAGDVSRRYFLVFRDTSNLRVGGSRRSFASLRRRAKLARESLPARHF